MQSDLLKMYYGINTNSGEMWPTKIQYGPSPSKYVAFTYASIPSNNQIDTYFNGIKKTSTRLLQSIKTYASDFDSSTPVIKQYVLNYEPGSTPGRYRIKSIAECSNDKQFKPVIFEWSNKQAGLDQSTWEQLLKPLNFYNIFTKVGDFNGDGKVDKIVPVSGTENAIFYASQVNGFSNGTATNFNLTNEFFNWQTSCVLPDINGDGIQDLINIKSTSNPTNTKVNYALSLGNGSISDLIYGGISVGKSSHPADPADPRSVMISDEEFYYGDFDGDGRTDILRRSRHIDLTEVYQTLLPPGPTTSGWLNYIYFSRLNQSGVYQFTQEDWLPAALDLGFSTEDPWVFTGECDGDGKSDIIVVKDSQSYVWLSSENLQTRHPW